MRENLLVWEPIKGPGVVLRRPGGHSEHVSLETLNKLRKDALRLPMNTILFRHPLTRAPVYRRNLKVIKKVPVHRISSNKNANLHTNLMRGNFATKRYNIKKESQVFTKREMIKYLMVHYFKTLARAKRNNGNIPAWLEIYANAGGLNRNGLGPKEVYDALNGLSLGEIKELFDAAFWDVRRTLYRNQQEIWRTFVNR